MGIRRVFVDWSRPALSAAAEWLAARHAAEGRLDLRQVVVAMPGGRAGRRLLEVLVDVAERRSLDLVPPRILTTGQLPELLYQAKKPFADDLTQHLAWVAALRTMPAERLSTLVKQRPDDRDLFAWLPLAELLASLHRELAADGLDCAAVVREGSRLAAFRDAARWKLLAEIQKRYLAQLDALDLWDLQTARLYAIEHRECRTEADIVLVGTVDMNQSLRQMLDLVADRVTSLVFAPDDLASRFDEHGCVIPAEWQEAIIPLEQLQIAVVGRPGDQADAVLRAIASFGGRFAAEDIVVGVPDERLVPYIEQRLAECELPARYGVGIPVSRTEACLLLDSVARWLDRGRFEAFADLVRHPAIEQWLLREKVMGDVLSALDAFQGRRLPSAISEEELAADMAELDEEDDSARRDRERLSQAWTKVAALLEPLRLGRKKLGEWGPAIAKVLVTVFGEDAINIEETRGRLIVAGCDAVREVLASHQELPKELSPLVTGAEALRMAVDEVGGKTVPPPADVPAIELLGWLELPLDDAPALVVTGMNEKIVPSSQNADQFLPNELRRHLRLEDNDRRYARDAYALSVLAASRQELRLIAGRQFADGEPLVPSRLLFTCDADETARRAAAWFGEKKELPSRVLLPGGLKAGPKKKFQPPHPNVLRDRLRGTGRELKPVESMKVTQFRDYLACPYRYFLRHRLRLEAIGDGASELQANQFGTLLHEVLNAFGARCLADARFARSTSVDEIAAFLGTSLDDIARRSFGENPLPAVRVQIEMVRRRLARFAAWQADWARDGWRIQYVEHEIPKEKAVLKIPGGTMGLRGRIDRVDVREGSDETVVFDYKTGDSGKTPEATHQAGPKGEKEWVDLQLPLYRHACQWLDVEGPVQVGYILLPKREEEIGAKIAQWDDSAFAEAIEKAEEIAQLVRDDVYWPASEASGTFEELAAICGDYRIVEAPEEGEE